MRGLLTRYSLLIFCASIPITVPILSRLTSIGSPPSQASQLIGTWHLVSRVVTLPGGAVMHDAGLGARPVGTLTYTADGFMSAQLMAGSRPDSVECAAGSSVASENNDRSINHYDAYFGTYTVDESKHIVTHHLQGALAAEDVGKNLFRQFAVAGDTLTIVTSTDSPQGRQVKTLKWLRGR